MSSRASKGSGSVRKRGASWYYQVDIGEDPATGNRRREQHGGFKTQRAARDALTTKLTSIQNGTYVGSNTMTVETFLRDHWLPSRASQVRSSTAASYEDALLGRVVPRIGAIRLDRLTPRHVEELYRDLLAGGGRDAKRGRALSARTVAYTGKIFVRALDDAVRLGLIVRNAAAQVERPKPRDREMRTWTPQEARRFLMSVESDRLRALWVLYLTAGLRRGEALGLRWGDIDLESGRLAVRRTLVAVGYRVEWSEPKTDRSRRVVALDSGTLTVLKAHRAAQAAERLALGAGYQDDALVFATVAGAPIHPQYVSDTFERRVKAAGLPRIRLHDTRHTSATLLLDEGVPLKVVSERLGHSSVSITADLYQHVLEHMQDEAASAVGRVLLG
jgi:Site-specific recombinase XerD